MWVLDICYDWHIQLLGHYYGFVLVLICIVGLIQHDEDHEKSWTHDDVLDEELEEVEPNVGDNVLDDDIDDDMIGNVEIDDDDDMADPLNINSELDDTNFELDEE